MPGVAKTPPEGARDAGTQPGADGSNKGPIRARRATMTVDASQTLSHSHAPDLKVRALRRYQNIGKHRVIALAAGVTGFISNDPIFRRVPSLDVLILDEMLQ